MGTLQQMARLQSRHLPAALTMQPHLQQILMLQLLHPRFALRTPRLYFPGPETLKLLSCHADPVAWIPFAHSIPPRRPASAVQDHLASQAQLFSCLADLLLTLPSAHLQAASSSSSRGLMQNHGPGRPPAAAQQLHDAPASRLAAGVVSSVLALQRELGSGAGTGAGRSCAQLLAVDHLFQR